MRASAASGDGLHCILGWIMTATALLDLFVARNRWPLRAQDDNRLFQNNGDVPSPRGNRAAGPEDHWAYHRRSRGDYDKDGRMDLFIG